MAKKHSSFSYETLVRFMLPNGILDYFCIDESKAFCLQEPNS